MLMKRSTKLMCLLIAFLWTTVIIGSSYAYFIDSVSVNGNVVAAGNLKAAMSWKNPGDLGWKDASTGAIFNYQRWEPGYTDVKYIKVENTGNLAFQYELNVYPAELLTGHANLLEVIDVYYGEGVKDVTRANYAEKLTRVGTLMDLLTNAHGAAYGILLPENGSKNAELPAGVTASTGSVEACMVLHMQEEAGNEYMGLSVGDGFKVQLYATQYMYEKDSFDNTYDEGAASELPELNVPTSMVIEVQPVNGLVPYDVWFNDPVNGVSATVPQGAKMADGATSLKLVVEAKKNSEAKVNVTDDEELFAYNVKVEGLAADNTVPVVINMGEVLPNGLNLGNYSLYHVENGNTVMMTLVDAADLDAHNEFTYDPVTGAVAVAMATFSEVTCVVDAAKAWEGNYDYAWYDANSTEMTIANADQLAAFGAIVGVMAEGIEQDSFSGKNVKLVADVNLGDKESENNPDLIFYPIGYNSDDGKYEKTEVAVTTGFYNFAGTFDGNGHTIGNIYQNTWEMKGDNNYYDASLQYYRDGMGLFGKVYGGTVKNLTVDHFSSDGEYTTTGVIAAYADGATFENIAITNCNPRVYNIGNGGIVGCVGWYAKDADLKSTFTNITVDNSNKISALWGSWDVACGGLVGQYYPTSGQTTAGSPKNAGVEFVNCHVSAQIDVYNDVCANYQYYAYRYAGMMIGSIRENETVNGHVYPKMEGITASGCTVHFGDWNDYYYCELVDNTTASYTHDYQMSRLVEIKAINGTTITNLDGTTGTVPTSGRANYVIVDYTKGHGTANATCYHFKDGAVWTHDMGGIQEGIDENDDGKDDLKEDKQHIYLEFNNLFTGYGWGVTSKGLTDFVGIENMDITHGSQEESVVKFAGKVAKLANNKAYKIGDIFNFVNNGVELKPGALTVTVTNLDEGNPVSAVFTRNEENWKNSTLFLTGTGKVQITIQDYYFCTPTTITVDVEELGFIYRVGNQNTVTKAQIAKLLTGTDSFSSMSIVNYKGNAEWNESSSKFTGTGIVTVKIDGAQYYLEVVDATNVTEYSQLGNKNSVLLNDITMSANGTYRLTDNKVLYGNGFTFDVTEGAYSGVDYDSDSYVIYLENSRLDNIEIHGAVYPEVGGTKNADYYRAIVMTDGDCKIVNSYISNGASPIRSGGDLELVNTTLKGGAYANLDHRDGHLILDNVTTINQVEGNDKYNNDTVILGLGITVYQEGGTEEGLKITIRNELKQYNYVSQAEADEYLTSTHAKMVKSVVFGDDFAQYQFTDSQKNVWVNTGIVSMNNYITADDIDDERTDKMGYVGMPKTVTLLGSSRNCYVYTFTPTTTGETCSGYITAGQGVIEPNVTFDFNNKNYIAKAEGSNDYCYADGGVVYISMDEGDTFNWDTSILTATKNGNTLAYTVKMNKEDYTGKSIAFSTAGTYEVIYSYEDEYNFELDNDEVTNFVENYTETVTINVAVVKATAKHAVFSFGANGTTYLAKTVQIGDKTYVMPNVSGTESGKIGSTTVSGQTVYYPITEMITSDGTSEHTGKWFACFPIFQDVLQIIDYMDKGIGDAVTYNQNNVKTVDKIPTTLKAVNPTTAFLYSMNATNYPPPPDPYAHNGMVCYTCNRSGLDSRSNYPRKEQNIVAEYTYTDNAGMVYYFYIGYHCAEQTKGSTGTCLAEGTMITLADGNKRAVEDLRKGDMVMAYDHVAGEVTTNKVIIVVKTGSDFYQNTFVFDDGTKLVTINEHGIYDLNLNRYVNIDHLNAKDYIGHDYVAIDPTGRISTKKLVAVESEYISGYKYDIVSENTLNYVAEDTLSVTHVLVDIINTFEFNEDMCYDQTKMEADIQQYGLYTYDEWQEYADIAVFEEYNIPVMKVGVSKGMYTKDYIISLINTFVLDDSVQIID